MLKGEMKISLVDSLAEKQKIFTADACMDAGGRATHGAVAEALSFFGCACGAVNNKICFSQRLRGESF